LDTESPHRFEEVPRLLGRLTQDLAQTRRTLAQLDPESWAQRLRVHLSVNTGPLPVISGLLRGLEEFKPSLIHVEEARRWPKPAAQARRPEAVYLGYDALRQAPEFDREDPSLTAPVRLAVREMVRWKEDFVKARPERPLKDGADRHFFFRKGAQEVLAVVVVRDPLTERLEAVRGVNLEVSLPTGTLCAERNAIGSALTRFPQLGRRDILAVAVLALQEKERARLGPCGSCAEWIRKVAEVNPDVRVVTFADASLERVFVEHLPI
jgi:cytidine deaminase